VRYVPRLASARTAADPVVRLVFLPLIERTWHASRRLAAVIVLPIAGIEGAAVFCCYAALGRFLGLRTPAPGHRAAVTALLAHGTRSRHSPSNLARTVEIAR